MLALWGAAGGGEVRVKMAITTAGLCECGCWRLYGEGLETGEYGTVVWMACEGWGATVALPAKSHT